MDGCMEARIEQKNDEAEFQQLIDEVVELWNNKKVEFPHNTKLGRKKKIQQAVDEFIKVNEFAPDRLMVRDQRYDLNLVDGKVQLKPKFNFHQRIFRDIAGVQRKE